MRVPTEVDLGLVTSRRLQSQVEGKHGSKLPVITALSLTAFGLLGCAPGIAESSAPIAVVTNAAPSATAAKEATVIPTEAIAAFTPTILCREQNPDDGSSVTALMTNLTYEYTEEFKTQNNTPQISKLTGALRGYYEKILHGTEPEKVEAYYQSVQSSEGRKIEYAVMHFGQTEDGKVGIGIVAFMVGDKIYTQNIISQQTPDGNFVVNLAEGANLSPGQQILLNDGNTLRFSQPGSPEIKINVIPTESPKSPTKPVTETPVPTGIKLIQVLLEKSGINMLGGRVLADAPPTPTIPPTKTPSPTVVPPTETPVPTEVVVKAPEIPGLTAIRQSEGGYVYVNKENKEMGHTITTEIVDISGKRESSISVALDPLIIDKYYQEHPNSKNSWSMPAPFSLERGEKIVVTEKIYGGIPYLSISGLTMKNLKVKAPSSGKAIQYNHGNMQLISIYPNGNQTVDSKDNWAMNIYYLQGKTTITNDGKGILTGSELINSPSGLLPNVFGSDNPQFALVVGSLSGGRPITLDNIMKIGGAYVFVH